jgi:hypothetical protein
MTKIVRLITCFEKEGDDLVYEIALPQEKLHLSELQKLYGIASENPMYDCYPINSNNSYFFIEMINQKFDFEKYDYYLQSYAV